MDASQRDWAHRVMLDGASTVHWQNGVPVLIEEMVRRGEAQLSEQGAPMCYTGKFTGRSPQDRFIVGDALTAHTVDWRENNHPISADRYEAVYHKMTSFLSGKTVYVRDAYAGGPAHCRLSIRVVNTLAWHNLFCHHMFGRPSPEALTTFVPDFTIINIPQFEASPSQDGTRQGNFVIINLSQRVILIGGTAYAGEMKKGIFTVLNYFLPTQHRTLSMHCAANRGSGGDTALFFGLSGTGKTTLSADVSRTLIGDDEHGWDERGIFNMEGGCYAKTIGLSESREPTIYKAIRFGTLVENMHCKPNSRTIDYDNAATTENVRCAYPLHYASDIVPFSVEKAPGHLFFLTCDAYGIFPPIARLNRQQALYHFLMGYTSKIAGTEMGVTRPQITFSACFGEAFLPLSPIAYATLLDEKLKRHNPSVWLVNTGWIGGGYGVGHRIALHHTRNLIRAALSNQLETVACTVQTPFQLVVPTQCPDVPSSLLQPRSLWQDPVRYDQESAALARKFVAHFARYQDADLSPILDKVEQGGPVCSPS